MLIASMTIFGTLGLFVRNIPVSSGELALYRAVLAALLITVFFIFYQTKDTICQYKKRSPFTSCIRHGNGNQLDSFI